MDNSLTFLYLVYGVSLFLLANSIVTTSRHMWTLWRKYRTVPNGLGLLRKRFLTIDAYSLTIQILAFFCLTSRFVISNPTINRYLIVTMVFGFCLFFYLKSKENRKILNEQYSLEHIEKAARIQHEMNLEKAGKKQPL